ncbi:MAG: hypothetical protein H7338_20450 [Candidatus Sericytochromatia bacterium]|nr:hypothetical protein [Candidatus Sericytochromatia bacterium]
MGRSIGLTLAVAIASLTVGTVAFAAPALKLTIHFGPKVAPGRIAAILAVTGVTVMSHPDPSVYIVTGRRRIRADQLATLFAALPDVAETDPVAPIFAEDQYQPMVFQNQPLSAASLTLTPLDGAKLDIDALTKALGASRVEVDPTTGLARVQLPASADANLARRLAESQPGVAGASLQHPYPMPSGAAQQLGSNASLVGGISLAANDVQVQFHPWADANQQQLFQSVFAAGTVRRLTRYAIIVRPGAQTAVAAARAYRLIPAVRPAEPHYGS